MTQTELLDKLTAKIENENINVNKLQLGFILENLNEIISDALKKDNKVCLGIGSLEVITTKPKKVRHPKTREIITIPAGKKIKFNSYAWVNEKLNKEGL